MTLHICRICCEYKMSQDLIGISSRIAKTLEEFDVRVPQINVCYSICLVCDQFLKSYESFKEMCWKSQDYFKKIEDNLPKVRVTHQANKVKVVEVSEPPEVLARSEEVEEEQLDELIEVVEDGTELIEEHGYCGQKSEDTDRESPKLIYFICKVCNADFATVSELQSHASLEHENAPKTCPVCRKRFYNPEVYKEHVQQAHLQPESMSKCQRCQLMFTDGKDLEQHQKAVHETTEHPLKCRYCGKVCRSENHLANHLLKHEEVGSDDDDVDYEEIENMTKRNARNQAKILFIETPVFKNPEVRLNVAGKRH